MPKRPELDKLDIEILTRLIADARTPFSDIANRCKVSPATIHLRFERLQRLGIVKGATLILDSEKVGYPLTAFVGLLLDSRKRKKIFEALEKIPEITELHLPAGDYDIFMRVFAHSVKDLHNLLNLINEIHGVQSTKTFVVLHSEIERPLQIDFPSDISDRSDKQEAI
jgi:Lrp/AsnC family transcriptional regulator for asnA, asnC and gidA